MKICISFASLAVAVCLTLCGPKASQIPGSSAAHGAVPQSGGAKLDSKENKIRTGRQIDMRSKLSMVQKIVEGISTEDFDMVEKGAIELVTLAESAAWKSSRDPFYGHYSANFEQAAKGLIQAAKSESPERATFAYVHVTFSCTACHQHVRGTIRTAR